MAKKYSKEYLQKLVEAITPAQYSARTRSKVYGTGFYGQIPSSFPIHYRSFRKMHDHELERGDRVSLNFGQSAQGLISFILDLGPIPSGMKNPVLVRIYPRKGFIRGNLRWENGLKFARRNAARASDFSRRARLTETEE
jgi:hypothetical protein